MSLWYDEHFQFSLINCASEALHVSSLFSKLWTFDEVSVWFLFKLSRPLSLSLLRQSLLVLARARKFLAASFSQSDLHQSWSSLGKSVSARIVKLTKNTFVATNKKTEKLSFSRSLAPPCLEQDLINVKGSLCRWQKGSVELFPDMGNSFTPDLKWESLLSRFN